jgi:ribosome-interacting GTPase 1
MLPGGEGNSNAAALPYCLSSPLWRGIFGISLWYILSMPANLPPEFFAAEKRYKQATDLREKTAALEELISTVPKHKGTDKLRADLRRKLSQLREEAVKKKRAGKGDLYVVERQGAAQVALIGLPNSGKSSMLKLLTNANPVIAEYPITTVAPLSGMMPFEDIQFQLVDLPPLGNESTDGWVSGILRNADDFLLVVDLAGSPETQAALLLGQLSDWKIPLLGEGHAGGERGAVRLKPVVIAGNKSDIEGAGEGLDSLKREYGSRYKVTGVSAERKEGVEELKRAVFDSARIIRAYTKEPGKAPDMGTPFVLPEGSTVRELAEMIHRDFVSHLKYACIWGSAKFDGQRVQRDYVLHDRDVVEYHIR